MKAPRLTEEEWWVVVRALDDYADDTAERVADYEHQNSTEEAEYYRSESNLATAVVERVHAALNAARVVTGEEK